MSEYNDSVVACVSAGTQPDIHQLGTNTFALAVGEHCHRPQSGDPDWFVAGKCHRAKQDVADDVRFLFRYQGNQVSAAFSQHINQIRFGRSIKSREVDSSYPLDIPR